MRPFPRLLWAELSCTGGLSTIQAPVLAETHAQEGARQGKRRRRRRKRKRRCWFSWLLSTFFRYGLLEGCRSLQVRALTAEGKAMKDKTKNNSTGQLPKKERFQFKEVVEMKLIGGEKKTETTNNLPHEWGHAMHNEHQTSCPSCLHSTPAAQHQPGIGEISCSWTTEWHEKQRAWLNF